MILFLLLLLCFDIFLTRKYYIEKDLTGVLLGGFACGFIMCGIVLMLCIKFHIPLQ